MTAPSEFTASPVTRTVAPRGVLRPRLRKAVLVTHILAAGAWIGIDVMVAVLVLVGWFSNDPQTAGLAYEVLGRFVVAPMLGAALLCLGTGLVLGLGTKWGLVRYRWVLVKLILNLVLCVLIYGALRPGMPDIVTYGQMLADGSAATGEAPNLFFPPAVSLTALSLATVLAVYKPWGRTRSTDGPRTPRKG